MKYVHPIYSRHTGFAIVSKIDPAPRINIQTRHWCHMSRWQKLERWPEEEKNSNAADLLSFAKYSKVSFCDGSFYDDWLLRPLSSRTKHTRLVVHHCRNSSVLSLLSALLALFRCACVSSFSLLVQSFKLIVIFPPMTSIKKTERKKKSKQLTLHSFLMSSEPQPGPSSAK